MRNHGKSIYRDLGTICIFLIRKKHEISTSQHVCRWSVAQILSISVFFVEIYILYFLFLDAYSLSFVILDDYLMCFTTLDEYVMFVLVF